jgi:hypothetical protein
MDSDLEAAIQASLEDAKKRTAADIEYDAVIAQSLQDPFDVSQYTSDVKHTKHVVHVTHDSYDEEEALRVAIRASMSVDSNKNHKTSETPQSVSRERILANSRLLNQPAKNTKVGKGKERTFRALAKLEENMNQNGKTMVNGVLITKAKVSDETPVATASTTPIATKTTNVARSRILQDYPTKSVKRVLINN